MSQRHPSPSKRRGSGSRKSGEGDGDWVKAFSEHHLKHRMFQRWRDRTSLLNPSPVTSGVMTYAVFKWISSAYDRDKNPFAVISSNSTYVFPFYAFKESDGSVAEYSISRLRSYVIDKIQVPTGRIPLLLHALGLLDAFQLQRMFRAWKEVIILNRFLDARYHKKRLSKVLRRWFHWSQRQDNIRYSYQVLSRYRQKRDLRMWLDTWKTQYKVTYCQHYLTPRYVRYRVLKAFHHHWIVSRFIKHSDEQAKVFWRRKLLYTSFFTLLSQLCKVAKVKSLIQRHFLYLQQPVGDHTILPSDIRHWILSILHGNLPSDADLTDETIIVDSDDGRGGIVPMQHMRKKYWKQGVKTWIRVLQMIQQRRWSRISQLFLITSSDTYRYYRNQWRCFHRWMTVTRERISRSRAHSTPASKKKQYRSPNKVKFNIVPDGPLPGSPSFVDSRHTVLAQLRRSRGLTSSLGEGENEGPIQSREEWVNTLSYEDRHQYISLLKFGLTKWRVYYRERMWLKKRYHILHFKDTTRTISKALGAWLMLTARYQVINRAANRLLCNTIQRSLWQSWFAWRNQYERAILIRNNRREIIALRNAEMKEFELLNEGLLPEAGINNDTVSNIQHTIHNPTMRKWSLFVRDRSRGKKLLTTYLRYGGRNTIQFYWLRWRALLEWDYLVNIIKRHWYGYRVRKLLCYNIYRYLQWYRYHVISKLLGYQRYLAYKHIFNILKSHHQQLQQRVITFSSSNRLKYAWKRFQYRCQYNQRKYQRTMRCSITYNRRIQMYTVLTQLKRWSIQSIRRKRQLYLHQQRRLSMVFHKLFVLNRYYRQRYQYASKLGRNKLLCYGWNKLRVTSNTHKHNRMIQRNNQRVRHYLLRKYLLIRWYRLFYQPRRQRRRVIFQRQYYDKAMSTFQYWRYVTRNRHRYRNNYNHSIKQYRYYRLYRGLQCLYQYRSNWSYMCRYDRRYNTMKSQYLIQQEEYDIKQRIAGSNSSNMHNTTASNVFSNNNRLMKRRSLSSHSSSGSNTGVPIRFRRGSDDLLYLSLLLQHPITQRTDGRTTTTTSTTTSTNVTGYHYKRRQQRQYLLLNELKDNHLYLYVTSRQYACILLRRTLQRLHNAVLYRLEYTDYITKKLSGHRVKKLKKGFRAIFINWRQALLRVRDSTGSHVNGNSGSLLSTRYRMRVAAALRAAGGSSDSSAGMIVSDSTRHYLRQTRLRRMTSTQRHDLYQLDNEQRRGELYLTWSQRKHRELVRQHIKRRIKKQSQLGCVDELLSSSYYYFHKWYIKSQQYFRLYRHLTKKRYLFICYQIRKKFHQWLYWARHISGRYHHRMMVRGKSHFIMKMYKKLLLKLQKRYRSTKKCFFILTTRFPRCQERLSLKQSLRRWWRYWQKKARRRRYKEQHRQLGGYYGFTSENKLLVINKLKKRMYHFLSQLKLLIHYRQEKERSMLPYRQRPYIILQEKVKNFLKLRFQRFQYLLQRKRCKRLIESIVRISSYHTRIRRVIRYWKKWLWMKKRIRKINRRFYLCHSLRIWCEQLSELLKEKQACRIMNKRSSIRIKNDIFQKWKVFTIQEGKLHAMFDIVRYRSLRWEKHRSLYAWSIVFDNSMLQKRCRQVQERSQERLRLRCFHAWYKQMIVSELFTWQNTKVCWQLWKRRLYWMTKQRLQYRLAVTFQQSHVCHHTLRLWQYYMNKLKYFKRSKKLSKRHYRKYSLKRALKKWRYRMLIHRVECLDGIHLSVPQRMNTKTYPLYRSLMQWLLLTRTRIYYRNKARMNRMIKEWKNMVSLKRIRRTIFVNRLEIFRQQQLQRIVWRSLFSLWHSRKVVSEVTSIHHTAVMHRTFYVWQRMFKKTLQAKRVVGELIQTIYRGQVHRCFMTWKIKSGPSYRLGCSRITQIGLYRWYNIYKAKRYHRLLTLCFTFTGWKQLVKRRELVKSLFLQRSKLLRTIVTRHLKKDHSLLSISFHKWRLADFSVKFSEFAMKYREIDNEYKQAEHYGDEERLHEIIPLSKVQMHNRILTELATSQAGSMLLFHAHLNREQQPWTRDEIDYWKARSPERTIPRSLEVQSHFLDHCENELDRRDLVWQRSQQLKNRLRRSTNKLFLSSSEEKMQSEMVPLREKMIILASPVARPTMGKYIGLRSGIHAQGFDHVDDVTTIRSRASSPSKQQQQGFFAEEYDSRWGNTYETLDGTQRRSLNPQEALLQELM